MKHRVRLHGKKPKSSLKRVKKVVKKKPTAEDLVKAVRHRAWPAVAEALAEGVSPEGIAIHGDPLIMAVAIIAPVKVVAAILKAGGNPDAINGKRETALFHATDPEIVKRLLRAGGDPNAVSKSGASPLHFYARNGRASAMVPLLEAGPAVEALDDEGRTPLMLAVEHARVAEARMLLRHGASVNVISKHGESLLHAAARQRTKPAGEIIEMLVAGGADVERRSRDEFTPLMVVRSPEAGRLLLDAGADVRAATSQGVTALHLTVRRGDVALARLLLAAKADRHARIAAEHPDRVLAGKSATELATESSLEAMRALFRRPS